MQRKKEAKKKPIGDGIKVDSGVTPYEFTKCGLKLKLDKPAFEGKNLLQASKAKSAKTTKSEIKPNSGFPLRKSRYAPPIPMPNEPIRVDAITPENNAHHDDVDLLEDGSIVSEKVQNTEIHHNHQAKKGSRYRPSATSVREKLTKLSLKSDVNMKKIAIAPSSKVQSRVSKIQTKFRHNDEGKENDDRNSSNFNSSVRHKGLKKQTVTTKHYTATTSVDAMKKERAEAIEILKEMERMEEKRRRLHDSDSSGEYYSSDDDNQYGEDEPSRNSDSKREEFGDGNHSFFNSDDNHSDRSSLSGSTPTSGKATKNEKLPEKNSYVDVVDKEFSWMTVGLKDETCSSVGLKDVEKIESQVGRSDRASRNVEYENGYVADDSEGNNLSPIGLRSQNKYETILNSSDDAEGKFPLMLDSFKDATPLFVSLTDMENCESDCGCNEAPKKLGVNGSTSASENEGKTSTGSNGNILASRIYVAEDEAPSDHDEETEDNPVKTFLWMPDGLKDATHLSISLRDIENCHSEDSDRSEASLDREYIIDDSNIENRPDSITSSVAEVTNHEKLSESEIVEGADDAHYSQMRIDQIFRKGRKGDFNPDRGSSNSLAESRGHGDGKAASERSYSSDDSYSIDF